MLPTKFSYFKNTVALTATIIFVSIILALCQLKSTNGRPLQQVSFQVVDLGKSEIDMLSNYGCDPWDSGIVEKFKKVMIVNHIFDTLRIPVYNCIKGTNTPFIEYDVLEFFEFDSTKASDIIFGPAGYEISVLRNDTVSLFLKVPDKRKKHKFFVNAKMDSAGVTVSKYFYFLE